MDCSLQGILDKSLIALLCPILCHRAPQDAVPNLAPSEHNDKDPYIQASIPRVPEEEEERKRREREREERKKKSQSVLNLCPICVIYVEYV